MAFNLATSRSVCSDKEYTLTGLKTALVRRTSATPTTTHNRIRMAAPSEVSNHTTETQVSQEC